MNFGSKTQEISMEQAARSAAVAPELKAYDPASQGRAFKTLDIILGMNNLTNYI
jgi:hypothetical protein